MRLVTASEMRSVDSHAIESVGIDSAILMENAGLKVLFAMEKILLGLRQKTFAIVCGRGNNGGDGLVVARHLFNNHVNVNTFIAGRRDELSPDAAKNLAILERCGYQPVFLRDLEDLDRFRVTLEFSDVILDAVYGTGFSGNRIEGYTGELIKLMNEAKAKKIALDVPSGLSATTGQVADPCVRADFTVTLGLPKLGLYLYPGLEAAGEVWIADIGLPQVSYDSVPVGSMLLNSLVAGSIMPTRSENSHKGTFGHVLILAGSHEYKGAGVLASYGALRSGVGLVTLGMPENVAGSLHCEVLPDVITRTFREKEGGFNFGEREVTELIGTYRSIVAGPGWGKNPSRLKSLESLLRIWAGGLVLDADALNLLSDINILKNHVSDLIITPHLGEAARLCGKTVSEISANLPDVARECARLANCVVVLKSSVTLIADPDGKLLVSSRPNSALAKGGSGDLLSGLIGGLMCQGLAAFHAAGAGVFLHAEAATIARTELGSDAVTVSEIASYLPRAFKRMRGEERGAQDSA